MSNKKSTGKSEHQVRVRMYNVGLGDAFLLTFPAPDRPRKVLIDCGVHAAGPGPHGIGKVVDQILNDVKEGKTARIDVVVATHRHRDHVSGFESPIWDDVQVGEVWMPWTEDPDDPEARRIREAQSQTAQRLTAALACKVQTRQAAVAGGRRDQATTLAKKEWLLELAANALTNEKAMHTLHKGFAGKPKRSFLPRKHRKQNAFESALLPGVTVHVLGPSREEAVIRDMDPPKAEHYLRRLDALASAPGATHRPFNPDWAVQPQDFSAEWPHLAMNDTQRRAVDGIGEDDDLYAATALEGAVNGTSLMLMFEAGAAHLLFPGDAQWGTWRAALYDPDRRALLQKTTFYKIGHHGSHNATPVSFVDQVLGQDFCAMVCTRATTRFPAIPKIELLQMLREKSKGGRVVRSDKADPADPKEFRRHEAYVDVAIPR